MIHVYRYRWIGVDLPLVNKSINQAFPAVLTGFSPTANIDLQTDDTSKADLDDVMASMGWAYVSMDPPTPAAFDGLDTVLTFGAAAIPILAAPYWLIPGDSSTAAAAAAIEMVAPRAGTLRNLYVRQNVLGIGSGAAINYEIFVNGIASGFIVALSDTVQQNQNLGFEVPVAQGDRLSLRADVPLLLGASPTFVVASLLLGSN